MVEIGDIFMVMDLLEPQILFYNQIDSKKLLPVYFYLLLLRGKQLENITWHTKCLEILTFSSRNFLLLCAIGMQHQNKKLIFLNLYSTQAQQFSPNIEMCSVKKCHCFHVSQWHFEPIPTLLPKIVKIFSKKHSNKNSTIARSESFIFLKSN